MTEAMHEQIVKHWTGRASVHYSAELVGTVIVVRDMSEVGGPTVTNAAELVVARLAETFGGLKGKRIVYRDSTGLWDELSLNAHTRNEAIAALRYDRLYSHVDVELTTEAANHYVVISGDNGDEIERLGPYADLEHARRCYSEALEVLRELGGTVAQ